MLGSECFCHRNKDIFFVLTHHLKNIGALRMGWCESCLHACMYEAARNLCGYLCLQKGYRIFFSVMVKIGPILPSLPYYPLSLKANFHICFQTVMQADVPEFVCKHHPHIVSISRFLQLTEASAACFPHSDWRAHALGFCRCRDRGVYHLRRIPGASGYESQDSSYRMES